MKTISTKLKVDAKAKKPSAVSFVPQQSSPLQRSSADHAGLATAPPIVHEVLHAPGQPLDAATRARMEPRFGHDFSRVRVHTDAKAAESTRAMNARAYTVERDVVFGAERYAPSSKQGSRLLEHELAHVVQQSRGGGGLEAEPRAKTVAEQITLGQPITPTMIGGAPPGLYADDDEEETTPEMPTTRPAFSLSWDSLSRSDMFQLTPPSLRVPPLTPLTPMGLPLTLPARPPSLSVSPTLGQLPLIPPTGSDEWSTDWNTTTPWQLPMIPPSTPVSPRSGEESETPELPSRLPLLSRGRFSLGILLGFPEAEVIEIPDAPDSSIAASLRRAEIINQQLTGEVPTGLEAVDKSELASVIWSIFSTHIAPDLARSVTSSLSTSTGPRGVSCELDLVILADFSGGGLAFTVIY